MFTRLEATRAELESQFGFNRFLEIYTQIQVLYTNAYGSIDNVLQQSLYNYYTLLIALVKYLIIHSSGEVLQSLYKYTILKL